MRAGCILKTDSHGSQEVDRNWERGTTDVTNTPYYNTLLAVFWDFSLCWKEKCVGLSGGALAIDIAHFKAKGMVFLRAASSSRLICSTPFLRCSFLSFTSPPSHPPNPPCAARPHDPPCCFLAFIFPSPQSVILSAPMAQLEFGCSAYAKSHFANTHWWWVGGGGGSESPNRQVSAWILICNKSESPAKKWREVVKRRWGPCVLRGMWSAELMDVFSEGEAACYGASVSKWINEFN